MGGGQEWARKTRESKDAGWAGVCVEENLHV